MSTQPNVTEFPRSAASTVEESLGQRIRRMRMSRNWRLSELADRSGIASSTLSKVENDRLSLNYDRLMQIAHGFEMSLSEFLADGDSPASSAPTAAASGRMCIDRSGESRELTTENYSTVYLCTRIRQKSMTPTVAVVKAANLQEFGPLMRHSGEEFIYVLSGTVQLHSEFYAPETMNQGDSAYFDAGMAHAYTRVGDSDATILCLMTGEGDFKPG